MDDNKQINKWKKNKKVANFLILLQKKNHNFIAEKFKSSQFNSIQNQLNSNLFNPLLNLIDS